MSARQRRKKISKQHTLAIMNLPKPLESLREEDEEDDKLQSPTTQREALLSAPAPIHIFEKDPAQLELAKAKEAQRKRESAETLLALEKIQDRIDYTITEYEGTKLSEGQEEGSVNFEVVEDPNRLFEMLTDPKVRSKYHQKLSVVIIGYEEKQEQLAGVLNQLQDFFLENQSRGTKELLEQAVGEDLDLDEATRVLGGALATAQNSVEKLMKIKKELNHLVAIVSAYPDTNKGRKKLEKALLKAEEDVATFSKNLEVVEASLKESSESCNQLQIQLDAKTKEITKLRKTADEVKLLKVGNEKLKRELGEAEKSLKEAQEELSQAKSELKKSQPAPVVQEMSQSDKAKMAELEEDLKQERDKSHKLAADLELLRETHQSELSALKAEHEAESSELRVRFEDQLKSLMEEDVFGDGDMEDKQSLAEGDGISETNEEVDEGLAKSPEDQQQVIEDTSSSPLPSANASEDKKPDSASASKASLQRDLQREHQNELERLREQCREKERKAQDQVDDVKSKSRKKIALLQSQLADINNQLTTKKETFDSEISELTKQLEDAHNISNQQSQELAALSEEKKTLLDKIQHLEEELERVKEELRVSQLHSDTPDVLSSALPPRQEQSPMESLSTIPLIALEEVLDDQPDSQVLMSGSADLEELFPTSLEQSLISMDPAPLGSPLQSSLHSRGGSARQLAPQSSPPQCSISVLAMSRLSHHSSAMAHSTAVSHNHPVVVEWSKAYDSIVKFKVSLISMLEDQREKFPQLSSVIEELKAMELHSLDRKQDALSQVTDMRFSLALLLHQMEQTLQESFCQMLAEIVAQEAKEAKRAKKGGMDDTGGRDPLSGEMESLVAHLTKQMRINESNHKAEVEKNKDTIAQLSSRIESLKIEVAKLQRAIPSDTTQRQGMIMFTRLDSERNTKALEMALKREKISSETFSQLTNSMDDYLTVPGQRLAALSQRWQEKHSAARLVQHVQKSCLDPNQASTIVQGIAGMEQKRQKKFSVSMVQLGAMRTQLAHSLTDDLSHIEKTADVFLIKPILSQRSPRVPDLITPIARPLPAPSRVHSAAMRTRPGTKLSGRTTATPTSGSNVRVIQSFLQTQRQQVDPQHLIDSINTANAKSSPETPIPRMKLSRRSRSSLSAHNLSPDMAASPVMMDTAGTWNVRASSALDTREDDGLSECPPQINYLKPTFSKMQELDLSRNRKTDNLLGHLLPNFQPHSYHYTSISCHRTPSPQKLIALPEEPSSGIISPSSMAGSSQIQQSLKREISSEQQQNSEISDSKNSNLQAQESATNSNGKLASPLSENSRRASLDMSRGFQAQVSNGSRRIWENNISQLPPIEVPSRTDALAVL